MVGDDLGSTPLSFSNYESAYSDKSIFVELKECESNSIFVANKNYISTQGEEIISSEVSLLPLPHIPRDQLQERDFLLRQPSNVEVTSVDIAAHGAFVVAGCSNGQVLLFDLLQANHSRSNGSPHLIGHIKAKGIHTNLLLSVVITEDCRFCFAGVIKGSSELLAIDVI